ncbi:hypothetical protein [Halodesulfovibrio sp.]|uniref:hypothetical protein n=1 Tax=Halodesulfovibrio sp. TaxID=1912772 RepID=UPI0025F5CE92|nr:hypothetical protein [Halodesulfovibrio sp.]MCT4625849.1 hypothetical protein [Halodesulfovibrio sp.]
MLTGQFSEIKKQPGKKLLKIAISLLVVFIIFTYISFVSEKALLQNISYSICATCIFYAGFELIPAWRHLEKSKYLLLNRLSSLFFLSIQFDMGTGLTSEQKYQGGNICSQVFFKNIDPTTTYSTIFQSTIPIGISGSIDEFSAGYRHAMKILLTEIIQRNSNYIKEVRGLEEEIWKLLMILEEGYLKESIQVFRQKSTSTLDRILNALNENGLLNEFKLLCQELHNIKF